MSLELCTVTLETDKLAISGAVKFEPFPQQVVNGVFVDTAPVVATVSGTTYTAALRQGVKYRLVAPRFEFVNNIFVCPKTSSANLKDLLEGYRSG